MQRTGPDRIADKEKSGSRRRHGHRTKGSAAAAGEDRGEARPGHMGAPSIRFFRRQGRNSFLRTKKATQQIMLSGCFWLARQEGFEPPTHGLEGRCSIQLSY